MKLRICLVSPYTLPVYCGNSNMAERLKRNFMKRGHEVGLFNSSKDDPMRAVDFSADIIHSLHAVRTESWVKTVVGSHPVPWLLTLTGTDYNEYRFGSRQADLIKKNLIAASAVTVFHTEACDFVLSCYPKISKKIHIVPQSVDIVEHDNTPEFYRIKYGLDSDKVVFLMVAGIRPVKNICCSLELFCDVYKRYNDVQLILVGPVIDQKEADRVLAEAERHPFFSYLGEKKPHEVREIMYASDVFLNTSLHEGMPGALLEAMAEAKPVIASRTTGNTTLVEDGYNGFLVPLHDRNTFISRITELLLNEDMRLEMGCAGRDIVEKKFSTSRETDSYISIYSSLIGLFR